MSRFALILASGTGSRAGGDIPKQFRSVAGKPLFYWPMSVFASVDDVRIVAVVHRDYIPLWNDFWKSLPRESQIVHTVVEGGASRIESVIRGLEAIAGEPGDVLVAVHDAARPLVTASMIESGYITAEKKGSVAVPVVPVSDSLRRYMSTESGETLPVDRSEFMSVQTPQVAPLGWLRDGYSREMKPTFTDDSSILQDAGYPVCVYEGRPDNMKVTTPSDFLIADALLRARH